MGGGKEGCLWAELWRTLGNCLKLQSGPLDPTWAATEISSQRALVEEKRFAEPMRRRGRGIEAGENSEVHEDRVCRRSSDGRLRETGRGACLFLRLGANLDIRLLMAGMSVKEGQMISSNRSLHVSNHLS